MISVVIPLYNKEKCIGRTLDCVLAQTYRDFEVVIVDDGSTDGSATIVENCIDSRVRLVRQSNGGVSAARNRGLDESRSEYVAFLDADDVWLPDHLGNLTSLIKQYPRSRAWATRYINNLNGKDYPIILNKMPFRGEQGLLTNYFEVCSCSQPPVWSSAVCVERSLMKEIGGFPVGVTSGEDLLTWARIAVSTDWAYSMKATAVYMMQATNGNFKASTRPHDPFDPVGNGLNLLLSSDFQRKSELKHFIGRFYKMKAVTKLRYGGKWDAIRECIRSLSYRPFAQETYKIILFALLPYTFQKRLFAFMRKYN